jgi:outer membrane immunogenic protein
VASRTIRRLEFGRSIVIARSVASRLQPSLETYPKLHLILHLGILRIRLGNLTMKKLAVTLFAVAAFSGSAFAADMAPAYTKAPAPMPVAVTNWTGCYVGGGGGYGMWNQNNTPYADDGVTRALFNGTTTSGGRGYFGTVQVGCDYQFNNFVVGAFGDYDFASIKGTLSDGLLTGAGNEKLTSQWAAGGRLGYLVFPNLLAYFSGGYTEAHFSAVNFDFTNSIVGGGTIGSPTGLGLGGRTYKGWFLGAGDEYALSFLHGLFWKTEYRVSEFSTRTDRFVDTTCATCFVPLTVDSRKWDQSVRTELVYRFNWGGAVVAKY